MLEEFGLAVWAEEGSEEGGWIRDFEEEVEVVVEDGEGEDVDA